MQQNYNNLSVGILSGGKSSRMGQDKALLTINSMQFMNIIVDEMSTFSEVLVSVDDKSKYDYLSQTLVVDEHKNIGPIEGIYQVLKHAHNEYVFVCAVDMPFLKKELAMYMAEFISSDFDCYVLMDEDRVHPLCAIYSKKILPIIEDLIKNEKYRLTDILALTRTKYIRLEQSCFDKKVVKNINTKDQYKKLILPVVFCVSGVKNSGKTGLIIKLINEFIKEDYKVAVIKHDGHDYTMDYEGTDTARFTEAGAMASIIFSDKKYSLNASSEKSIEELILLAAGADIILLEGMKTSHYPKIEVIRGAVSKEVVCSEETIMCVATDIPAFASTRPVFDLDDVKSIYNHVKKHLGLELVEDEISKNHGGSGACSVS